MSLLLRLLRRDDSDPPEDDDFNNTAACGGVVPDGRTLQWLYCPSEWAAIAVCAAFAGALCLHILFAIKYRKLFCLVVIVAALAEAGGFGVRAWTTQHQLSAKYYQIQSLSTTLSPLILNAYLYMIIGRLIDMFIPDKHVCGIYSKFIAQIFVWSDVATFFVQLVGAVLLSIDDSPNDFTIGKDVYMGGVGLQLASQLFFFVVAGVFHSRAPAPSGGGLGSWRNLLISLYVVFVLISIRVAFKLAEFNSGLHGPIPSHEIYFYALDAAPVCLSTYILVVFHPGRVLRGPGSDYRKLGKEERRQLKRDVKSGRQVRTKLDEDGVEFGLLANPQPTPVSSAPPRYGGPREDYGVPSNAYTRPQDGYNRLPENYGRPQNNYGPPGDMYAAPRDAPPAPFWQKNSS